MQHPKDKSHIWASLSAGLPHEFISVPPRSRAATDSVGNNMIITCMCRCMCVCVCVARAVMHYLQVCLLFGSEMIHDAPASSPIFAPRLPPPPPSLFLQEINRRQPLMRQITLCWALQTTGLFILYILYYRTTGCCLAIVFK